MLVERRARAAFVTLNRPDAANALSKALVSGLEAMFAELAGLVKQGDDLRAVVVTGVGKAFSAGRRPQGTPGDDARPDLGLPRRARIV